MNHPQKDEKFDELLKKLKVRCHLRDLVLRIDGRITLKWTNEK
jgi:hypothetical protein